MFLTRVKKLKRRGKSSGLFEVSETTVEKQINFKNITKYKIMNTVKKSCVLCFVAISGLF
ncbi:hypothetical protein BOVMAS09_08730 [Streptococcus uberis]